MILVFSAFLLQPCFALAQQTQAPTDRIGFAYPADPTDRDRDRDGLGFFAGNEEESNGNAGDKTGDMTGRNDYMAGDGRNENQSGDYRADENGKVAGVTEDAAGGHVWSIVWGVVIALLIAAAVIAGVVFMSPSREDE